VSEGENSQWDMTFNTFGRINKILYEDNNCIFNKDVVSWHRMLRVLFMETAPLKKKHDPTHLKEYTETKELLSLINAQISDHLAIVSQLQKQSNKKIVNLTPSFALENLMFDLDERLRDFLLKKGILMRYGEDAGMSML